MKSVIVVGSQWGDEGKGKIVDWLSDRADVIVRFQGGHNAGHTLVINGVTYKLSLLPSGVVRRGKMSLIGNGVVIDPWALLKEIDTVREQGVDVSPENLKIAENACLILPIHQRLDAAAEALRGAGKLGTTGRGIGPAYEDKAGRRALRVCDLSNIASSEQKLKAMLAHHNPILTASGAEPMTVEEILNPLREIAPRILSHMAPVWRLIEQYGKEGKRILFEGAQGAMLDVDYGTYPFVTSSNTVAGAAAVGAGVGMNSIGFVLGITKAYTTRVGSGPFPSELHDETGQVLGERGHEFGTVTGRKRRCGWFDAALVRQAVTIGGIDGIALTKLDVLDGMKELSICTGYSIEGKAYDYLPSCGHLQSKAQPVYETMPGWQESTRGIKNWKELPKAAMDYIRRIETLIHCPVALLSTSPSREDTILIEDPFGASKKAA